MMPSPSQAKPRRPRHARGAAIIEFAIVATLFFTLLLGITEFGRWVYTLNAASEATRLGARLAVVCDLNDSAIKARMRNILPQAQTAQIQITYYGSNTPGSWDGGSCSASDCAGVSVRLQGVSITGLAWFLPRGLPVPAFATSLTRESMQSAIDGSPNPVCN